MRFHDVQDLTKTIKSEQRNAAYKRMHDAFLDRLSVFNSNKIMTVFGAFVSLSIIEDYKYLFCVL